MADAKAPQADADSAVVALPQATTPAPVATLTELASGSHNATVPEPAGARGADGIRRV
jgi:hypothetical protein